jgi:hypothetical protein
MSEGDERVLGKDQVDIAIDNIIFEGLDDLVAAVNEAEKAAREDGNIIRLDDLEKMKGILVAARQAIAKVQVEAGKRDNA